MRQTSTILLFAALAATGKVARAQSVHIDFDNLANCEVITTQYPEATFSTEPGFENVATAQNYGSSLPNFLCTSGPSCALTCVNEVYLAFTSPVSNLTFLAIGDNDIGVTAKVDVFVNGAFAATVDVVTDGDLNHPDLVNLSAFSNVTRIEIHDITDLGGLGWDDFIFDLGVGSKYCTANFNSTGSPADLSAAGSRSAAAGTLALTSAPVPNQFGVFFHGQSPSQTPFGNGFLCTTGGITRGAVVSAASNVASYTYDNSDPKHSLTAFAGSTRYFQHWFRDPMGGGALFNTSNALSIAILP